MKLAMSVMFLPLAPLLARGEALMPCPDCGREVSKRVPEQVAPAQFFKVSVRLTEENQ